MSIIPLANAFRPDYADSLDGLSDLIEKLKVPVTVVGVGAQATIEGREAERGRRWGRPLSASPKPCWSGRPRSGCAASSPGSTCSTWASPTTRSI